MSSSVPPPPPPKPPRMRTCNARLAKQPAPPPPRRQSDQPPADSSTADDLEPRSMELAAGVDEVDRPVDGTLERPVDSLVARTVRCWPRRVSQSYTCRAEPALVPDEEEVEPAAECVELVAKSSDSETDAELEDEEYDDAEDGIGEPGDEADDELEEEQDDEPDADAIEELASLQAELAESLDQTGVAVVSNELRKSLERKHSLKQPRPSGSRSASPAFYIEEAKLIDHLRMRNPELLPKLIKMHLSMLLDLNGDAFANIFEEPAEEAKRFATIKKRKHESKQQEKPIFQQALTEEGICRMYLLIDFIGKESNISQEGIFRKCGSTGRQQELKFKLQNRMHVDLDSGEYTVHDCTNVLKTCLSELPEPLLSDHFFKLICQCGQLVSTPSASASTAASAASQAVASDAAEPARNDARQMKIVQLTLLLLSLKKRKFAQDLLALLQRVSSKENSENKMNARNLATLFAPHLLCPKQITATEMQQWVTPMTDHLEFLIQQADQIFEPPGELLLDVRKELDRLNRRPTTADEPTDGDCVNTVYTFCDRSAVQPEKKLYTEQHVAELYAYIQTMPETPSKKKLIKQFNRQNGGLTPQPDKENSTKRKGGKLGIRSFGDKLIKNLFKSGGGGGAAKNHLSASRKSNSVECMLDEVDTGSGRHSGAGRARAASHETLLDAPDRRVRRPPERYTPIDSKMDVVDSHPGEDGGEVPLGDLTVTKFCIDDEDDHFRPPSAHKKQRVLGSREDILVDVPYASESVIV